MDFDLLPLTATADENSQQYQSNSPADETCGSVTDAQTPSTPESSWSTPDPDLVQKRAPALFCPAPATGAGKRKLRPEEEIEPDIPYGEPDDSRNYGGPNVRLPVPGGEEDDKKRCASQKRTLCCKGPPNLPRVVRNCFLCMFLFSTEWRGEKRANMGGLGETIFRSRFVRIIGTYIVVEGRMYVSLPFHPTPLFSIKSCADVHRSQRSDIAF